MAKAWYQDIIDTIEKYLNTDLPVQIVHFPSTGITSALNKYRGVSNKNDNSIKFFIIDFRVFHFSDDANKNQIEFIRIVQEHIEQHVLEPIKHDPDHLPYRQLELLFKSYNEQGRKVVVNLQNILSSKASQVKGFKDFLIFLDQLRDQTSGEINILISTTFDLKDSNQKLPIPLITKYFNYFRRSGLEQSISSSILDKSVFKSYSKEDVEYLIDLSGGLAVLVKSLIRDLTLNDKTLSDIDNLNFDEDFFDEYTNVKHSLDRIFQQLHKSTIDTLIAITYAQDVSNQQININYLSKVGIIDDDNHLKGIILPVYIKKTFPSEIKRFHGAEAESTKQPTTQSSLVSISDNIKVHKNSGEIYFNNKANGKYFSEKEFKIFEYLYINHNKPVSRDDIAKILWGEAANEKYSDWAIDKTVSRIREKLEDTKPYKILKTLRGKGFLLVI